MAAPVRPRQESSSSVQFPISPNEIERLAELERYAILGTPPEIAFDRITSLAARFFQVPIAALNFIAGDYQWFKSCVGLDMTWTSRNVSVSSWAILADEVMVIPDTLEDSRVCRNPFVTMENGFRFYAGAPLITPRGYNLGTLCVVDTKPRADLTANEKATLCDLAATVISELELRLAAREAEESRAMEQRLASVAENSLDFIAIYDLDATPIFVNKAGQGLLGAKDLEECKQIPGIDYFADEDRDIVKNIVLPAIHQNGSWKGELRFRHFRTGAAIPVFYDAFRIDDPLTGRPINFATVTRDITERKQMEMALAERAKLMALAADVGVALTQTENLPDALQLCAEAIVRHLDAAFARIWTLSEAGDVLDLRASAGLYTHLDGSYAHVPADSTNIGHIVRDREPYLSNDVQNDPRINDREWARRKGLVSFAGYPLIVGSRSIGVLAAFACHPLQQDAFSNLAAIAHSIAAGIDRKRVEQVRKQLLFRERAARHEAEIIDRLGQLLVSELQTERIVQAVTDAATELTGAQFGAFFYNVCNAEGESYTLYTISGVEREAFSKFPMPRNTAVFEPTFTGSAIVRSGNIRKDPRYGKNAPHHGMPEGHLPVCSYLAVPVVSRSGEVLGGLFFGHEKPDIFTEAHERIVAGLAGRASISMDTAKLFETAEHARVQAESSARELARSNSDLERFAFAASHDLQEPLRMVTSYSQLLARKYKDVLDAQANEFLGYIQSGTERMASLIKGLLSYSQAVQTEIAPETVDCAVVLNEVLKNCRALIEEAQADIMASPLPTVVADRSQITQLFQNLLTNAIKYRARDRKPQVRIEAANMETGWLFSVTDNGIGIAPEHQSRVFVMFKRLHKKEYSGTGIGLALCQRIVEGHGGRIWVESELGVGSTFYFTFPKQGPPKRTIEK